jgi:probable rRNA maturation factor
VGPDSRRLRVTVTDGEGRQVRSSALARWLEDIAPARTRGDLTIALVTDGHIQDLNRRFRRRDAATDVLSFPASTEPERRASGADKYLGDIAIATGVARRQAREAGHSYQAELRTLALHGLLHLLGYDHHRASDRTRMARFEVRLRRQGGLQEGLIERARGARPARPLERRKGTPMPGQRRPDRDRG